MKFNLSLLITLFLVGTNATDWCSSSSAKPGYSTIGSVITVECEDSLFPSDCCHRCFAGDHAECVATDFSAGCCVLYSSMEGLTPHNHSTAIIIQNESGSCTGESLNPYTPSGDHVACCSGLTETLANWDNDGHYYNQCIVTGSASCTSHTHPGCAELEMSGLLCCPHQDGTLLGCCDMAQSRRRRTSSPSGNIKGDFKKIICPFLSTLVHEDALPARETYMSDELTDLVLHAGLSRESVGAHIHAQFRSIRTQEVNIFNLEGLPDEHRTSSGINDCNSDYSNYQGCPADSTNASLMGVRICPTANKTCGVPSMSRFNFFWACFDSNGDGYLTPAELRQNEAAYDKFALDINEDPKVEGMLAEAFTFLIQVFGVDDRISRSALEDVTVHRQYPSYYKFAQGCSPDWEQIYPAFQGRIGHELQFGIRSYQEGDHSGRWLAIDDNTGAVVTSTEKRLWTVEVQGQWSFLRSSHNGLWLNVGPDGTLGSGTVPGENERWEATKYTAAESKLSLKSYSGGILSVGYTDYVPRLVQNVSRDEKFAAVYCQLFQPIGLATLAQSVWIV